jgi:hypothetical protein
MSGHTPGPWKVGYRSIDVGCENEKAGGYAKLFDVRGWGYLTGHGHGGLGLDELAAYAIQKANARLIAAAPDMLEALLATRSLVSEAAMVGFNFSDGDWADRLYANQAKISRAIAKAEGRTDA